MRRNASYLLVCTLALALAGCKNKNKSAASEFDFYDPYAMPAAGSTYEPIPPAPAFASATMPVSDPWDSASFSAGARHHTVVQKDTLFSLARQYYGDHTKWRDIYEANRTQISDPNKIRVGQRLLIP